MHHTGKSINILGAGPAGLSAAISLAQAGYDVHVHERYEVAGKRFQGDLQGIENWSTKEDVSILIKKCGLDFSFEATPFNSITLMNGKKEIEVSSKDPLFYLVKRGTAPETLDSCLSKQALRDGVNIHYRSNFLKENADIIATGPLRKSLVATDKGVIFSTSHPNMAIAIFHDDLAYLGYSYLLVSQGYGCLCTVVFNDFHRLNSCFEKTVAFVKKRFSLNLDHVHPVGGVGSFSLYHPAAIENRLLVGEAAGIQDLLWGFGIRTALKSGYLAAQSIIQEKDYQKTINKEFHTYLKASLVNRFLWETMKWNKRPLMPLLLRFPISLRSNFKLLYSYSPIHRLIYPFALKYIKRHYPQSIGNEDYSYNINEE